MMPDKKRKLAKYWAHKNGMKTSMWTHYMAADINGVGSGIIYVYHDNHNAFLFTDHNNNRASWIRYTTLAFSYDLERLLR